MLGPTGCFEEEKMALLEFKAFVKSGGYDADDLLPSWVNLNDPKNDCCKWERVTCDHSTEGHVIELSLSNTRQFDSSSFSIYDPTNSWYLNVSLFQPFKELRVLNLSLNVIAGWIQNKELKVFESLEVLDLANNMLSGSAAIKDLASLSMLPKLKRLSLEANMLNEDIISILGTLPSLSSLDLSSNQLEGPLSKRVLLENGDCRFKTPAAGCPNVFLCYSACEYCMKQKGCIKFTASCYTGTNGILKCNCTPKC